MVTFLPSFTRRLTGFAPGAQPSSSQSTPGLSILGRVVAGLLAWQDRAHQRSHLASLDDRMLRDMGITRDDVARAIQEQVSRR
ncbi:MAG: DUF1127 domain-containing protein [Alphaproteobacteria bacterium]